MFNNDGYTTDQARLRGFVEATAQLVSTALSAGHWSLTEPPLETTLMLDPDALEPANAALMEFNKQGHLPKLLTGIDRTSDLTLQLHGLSGEQLRFKLNNVQLRERVFRSNVTFGPLRRLINAIDTLLESILDAVPGGGALKELKDAALDATEDDES